MNHYIDIALLPDPEFPETTLMNALFMKLHRGLVAHGTGDIGVSFPEVDQTRRMLGRKLRLHGTQDSLEKFMSSGWTRGMRDHMEVTAALSVPANSEHRVVRRMQAKSSVDRLRRRLMQRKSIDAEAACEAIPDSAAHFLDLPYVEIASHSTGQNFKLFIEHGQPSSEARSGSFSAYGLSAEATVPWF